MVVFGGFMRKFKRAVSAAKNTAIRAIKTAAVLAQESLEVVQDFTRRHPYWTAGIIAGLLAAGVVLVAPHMVLGALGWQANGVLAGSAAAGIQSAVYGAFTTGAFSALQSFTMTAAAVPVGMLVAGGFSLTSAAALIGLRILPSTRG